MVLDVEVHVREGRAAAARGRLTGIAQTGAGQHPAPDQPPAHVDHVVVVRHPAVAVVDAGVRPARARDPLHRPGSGGDHVVVAATTARAEVQRRAVLRMGRARLPGLVPTERQLEDRAGAVLHGRLGVRSTGHDPRLRGPVVHVARRCRPLCIATRSPLSR
jgi:hypothetical protein